MAVVRATTATRAASRTRWTAALVAAVALSAGLAGCGKKDDSVTQAETRYCTATDEVQAAFSRFAHMDPDVTTATDVKAARDALANALGHLEDAATDVASARDKAGNDPITAFNKRIQNIPDDASLTQIGSDMARAGGDFLGDVKNYVGDLNCKKR